MNTGKQPDLLALIKSYIPDLHSEGESVYVGPCPFCVPGSLSGKNRLRVKPHLHMWTCQKCILPDTGHWDDAVGFLRRMEPTLSYVDACTRLGIDPYEYKKETVRKESTPPSEDWMETMTDLIDESKKALWTEAGKDAKRYLEKDRCLTFQTIWDCGLGFNAERLSIELPKENISIPAGIVIPLYGMDNNLWGVKVATGDPKHKYHLVPGSVGVLQGFDSGDQTLMVVEGEFDLFLAYQLVGDLIDIGTLGSSSASLTDNWYSYVAHRKCIVPMYDMDSSGESGWKRHWGWIKGRLAPRPILPRGAKDTTQFVKMGGDFRAFIQSLVLPVVAQYITTHVVRSEAPQEYVPPVIVPIDIPPILDYIEEHKQASLSDIYNGLGDYPLEVLEEHIKELVEQGDLVALVSGKSTFWRIHPLSFDYPETTLEGNKMGTDKPYWRCENCDILDWISRDTEWLCSSCGELSEAPESIIPLEKLRRPRPLFGR